MYNDSKKKHDDKAVTSTPTPPSAPDGEGLRGENFVGETESQVMERILGEVCRANETEDGDEIDVDEALRDMWKFGANYGRRHPNPPRPDDGGLVEAPFALPVRYNDDAHALYDADDTRLMSYAPRVYADMEFKSKTNQASGGDNLSNPTPFKCRRCNHELCLTDGKTIWLTVEGKTAFGSPAKFSIPCGNCGKVNVWQKVKEKNALPETAVVI